MAFLLSSSNPRSFASRSSSQSCCSARSDSRLLISASVSRVEVSHLKSMVCVRVCRVVLFALSLSLSTRECVCCLNSNKRTYFVCTFHLFTSSHPPSHLQGSRCLLPKVYVLVRELYLPPHVSLHATHPPSLMLTLSYCFDWYSRR
jgi:hypothetical protein